MTQFYLIPMLWNLISMSRKNPNSLHLDKLLMPEFFYLFKSCNKLVVL